MTYRNRVSLVLFLCLAAACLGCNIAPEDEIIDKKTFLSVYSKCDARSSNERVYCVMDTFKTKTDEFCAKKQLSLTDPKCVELHEKVTDKIAQNFTDKLKDAIAK